MSMFKKKEQNREESAESHPGPDRADIPAKRESTSVPDFKPSLDDPVEEHEESKQDSPTPGTKSRSAGFRTRKVLFFVAIPAFCLVVISSGLLFYKFKDKLWAKQTQNLEPVTSITRPVPIPDYREMLDFLVLNELDNQKTITSFRLEVAFCSPSRYQSFKEQNVMFRDTVYSFLQKQNSSRNTARNWQTVVENELPEYLKVKLPQSWADAIKLAQVENL